VTRLALLLLALLLAAAAPAQTMYKWVDEKGVTHFSETPPPDGKGQKVEVKPSAPSSTAPADAWKQRDLESRRSRILGEQHEQARAEQARDGAALKSRCDRARRELEILETPVRVFSRNDKKEKVYVTDEERARDIAELKRLVGEKCPS
jgi:hypothetical protein